MSISLCCKLASCHVILGQRKKDRFGGAMRSLILCLPLVLILGSTAWAQRAQSQLSARDLFYREKPDNDVLPTPPKKADKPSTGAAASNKQPSGSNGQRANVGRGSSAGAGGASRQNAGSVPAVPVVQHLGLRYNVLVVDGKGQLQRT